LSKRIFMNRIRTSGFTSPFT